MIVSSYKLIGPIKRYLINFSQYTQIIIWRVIQYFHFYNQSLLDPLWPKLIDPKEWFLPSFGKMLTDPKNLIYTPVVHSREFSTSWIYHFTRFILLVSRCYYYFSRTQGGSNSGRSTKISQGDLINFFDQIWFFFLVI